MGLIFVKIFLNVVIRRLNMFLAYSISSCSQKYLRALSKTPFNPCFIDPTIIFRISF